MKIFAVMAISMLAILVLPAVAQDYNINGDSWWGCVTEEGFEKIIGYAAAGDEAAFKNALVEGLMSGTITMFTDGEPVYLESAPFLSGKVEVRRPGESQTYWTNSEAIKSK